MNRFTVLCLALLLSLASGASAWRLVRIPVEDPAAVSAIASQGYDLANVDLAGGFLDILVELRFVDDALQRYPGARVLPAEWAVPMHETHRNEFGYYYGPNENAAFWANLASGNDMVDTPVTFGTSYQGRGLYYVRITNAGPSAPTILFTSLTHAREPGGNSAVIDFAQWLTSQYGSDTMATFILNNAQVYFVPIVNPDGYVYNLPSGGPNHRKNMNWSAGGNGVDLNRNWGYMWGYDNYGSSGSPSSETYRGTAAFSEPETQALSDWMETIQPLGGFHYHTYGKYLLYPWGYVNQPTPDQATFQAWGAQMTAQNGYEYGRAGQILYTVNGEACDWAYGEHTWLFFTPEVGSSGFWGGQNDTTIIVNDNLDCRYMNKLLCMNLLGSVGIHAGTTHGVEGQAAPGVLVFGNPVGSVMTCATSGFASPEVSVHDVTGRLVSRITGTGTWTVPENLGNGVYFIVARENGVSAHKAFTLLR